MISNGRRVKWGVGQLKIPQINGLSCTSCVLIYSRDGNLASLSTNVKLTDEINSYLKILRIVIMEDTVGMFRDNTTNLGTIPYWIRSYTFYNIVVYYYLQYNKAVLQ